MITIRKKTQEQYEEELKIKNPNIELTGKYIDANTKTEHHCVVHDIYWLTTPSRALQGCGCEKCTSDKIRNSKLWTHEKYVEELDKVSPHIKVREKYIDARTPILHECLLHDVEWMVAPSNVLHGHGCYKCGYKKIGYKNSKNREQYEQELKIANPNVILIGEYTNATTPTLHKCIIDGYEWMPIPSNLLYGRGCPKCAGNLKKTDDEYTKELEIINSNIEALGKYINMTTPILHRCKIDGYEWKTSPASTLQGCGCPICGIKRMSDKRRKTHECYVEEVKNINPMIEVVGEYKGANTPILHRCLIDGCEWYASPSNILSGHGCPKCKQSMGEKEVGEYLDLNNIKFETQKRFDDCRDNKPLPFDFYLPEYNLCIEYDGEQHFHPVDFFGGECSYNTLVKHDQIKNNFCNENNIDLLRIPYYKDIKTELDNFFIYLI